jgi:hypothetical protein
MEGQVRMMKESGRARGAHVLSSAEGDSSGQQKNSGKRGHSLPVEHGDRDKSEQQRKANELGALTNCRVQNEG